MSGTDRTSVAHLFPGDTDSDGIPDAYEQYYCGTLANHTITAPAAGTFSYTDPSPPGGSMYYRMRYLP